MIVKRQQAIINLVSLPIGRHPVRDSDSRSVSYYHCDCRALARLLIRMSSNYSDHAASASVSL